MKIVFDTSTLIAGMLSDHMHHSHASPWFLGAARGLFEMNVSAHSLAETYSVLTKLPRRPKNTPAEAKDMINDGVMKFAIIEALNPAEYWNLIVEISQRNLGSGMIFDAISAAVAEREQADHLLTINQKHFERVWPSGDGRIISPLFVSPVDLFPNQQ